MLYLVLYRELRLKLNAVDICATLPLAWKAKLIAVAVAAGCKIEAIIRVGSDIAQSDLALSQRFYFGQDVQYRDLPMLNACPVSNCVIATLAAIEG